jgi:hypothetical protein
MMVSRYDDSRLLLILQIDHSRVAGLLAAHWGNDLFAPLRPYASMVVAAQEHDSGWWDWEIKPTINDQGYPIDYINTSKSLGKSKLDFFRNGIERVAQQDPYAGLIDLMHGVGLLTRGYGLLKYMPDYSPDPQVQDFLRDEEALRLQLLQTLRSSETYRDLATDEHIWTNYKLMEIFDQLGQFICNRYPFNTDSRKNGPSNTLSDVPVPVRPGLDDVQLTVDVQDETRAVIRPWPFDAEILEISFPARLVPDRPYSSQAEFLPHYYKAERITITYTLHAA